jgi:GAF domain-containing protein
LLALMALTALASQQFREQAANAALLERQVALRTGELRTETAALETLNRTGSALAGELDIDRIVQNVIDAGVELTGAQVGAFFYNDDAVPREENGRKQERYRLYAISGASHDAFADFPAVRNTKVFSPTFREGRTIRSDDILADANYGQNAPHGGMPGGHPPVRSYMAVPVLSGKGEVHGALLFGHDRPGVFTERAERLVTGLAAQAAIALENGRLYQSTRMRSVRSTSASRPRRSNRS